MSLKDLFGKTSEKIVSNKQLEDLYQQAESQGFLEEIIVDKERFLPSINFYTASNFAKYGSAEKYYVDAIKNIYENYPYDGSKKEQLKWRNNSSQLDLFIFDNVHPLTTGYINLNTGTPTVVSNLRHLSTPSYVTVKGGPNKAIDNSFDNSNLYDLNTNRESNLGVTNYGNTVEFWFKDNLNTSSIAYESGFALFDLWNGVASGSSNYTRLTIAHTGSSTLLLTYASGNIGIVNEEINYNLDKSSWHHYAFVFDNSSTDLKVKLFLDGNLHSINTYNNCGFNSLADNSNVIANIGCYIADSSGLTSGNTTGASYGSYDEFRFWKIARTSQQIYRNWYAQVGGGSNTDDSNTNLGVYFKFNEGIADNSNANDIDKVCLDYSGRVSNGLIVNYNVYVRSTGSAIDNYFNETIEEKTPIVFSSNPLIISRIEEYAALGAVHDRENNSSIYSSLPSWITDEAEVKELPDLQNLTQIISSYFDTLHNQIGALTTIKNIDYDGNAKPKPFIKNALISNGFDTSELFNNSTFLEEILSKTEEYNFDDTLSNVKNFIYQNIYNNLSYIYKSKGTEKSFRNLIRCFGVDDELIKINLYANNAQYDLTDSYDYSTTYKKFVDFNDVSRYEAVVFQKAKSGDSNTKGYISGSLGGLLNNIPVTLQAEVIFPRKFAYDETALTTNNFANVSLFGARTAKEDEADLSFSDADDFNLKVYAIKNNFDSVDAYFKLVGNLSSSVFTLTSSLYRDVYDNQKWNFSVRIKPNNYGQVQQSYLNENSDYTLEFTGYNTLLDSDVNESFKLSTTINKSDADAGLSKNKRIYLGANCTNFIAGTAVEKSDVKISSVRYWLDYLEDEELKVHSYDSSNYGRKYPNWNVVYTDKPLTKINSLLLNWEFNKVTGSDSSGNFIVDDLTSGSLTESEKETYGFYSKLLNIQYPAFGNYFSADDSQVVNKEYIYSAKQKLPETFNGSDLIQIPVIDDVRQSKTNKPVSFYFSIEKSISQVINSEILNWFATIKDFNNLIGEPIEKYNSEYKNLKHLRQLFFEKVNNTPDVERFIEFYKWLDSSISLMISQLIPASANVSEKVRNVIESHLLERNKYENKLPRIERREEIVSNISSHLDYTYLEQAAGDSSLTASIVLNDKILYEPLWSKNRVSRVNSVVSTPVEIQNDIDREIIRQVKNNNYFNKSVTLYSLNDDVVYEGNEQKNKQFAKVYRFLLDKMLIIDSKISVANINNFADEQIIFNEVNNENKIGNHIKNFVHAYEYLNTVGRTGNNKSFVDLQGNLSGAYTDSGRGFFNRALPNRLMENGETRKTIISERFSAPGGPEVLSRGALDRDAEEYSVYNELNNRNYRVRKYLNSWFAETSSIDTQNPSYHKINKNVAKYPADSNGDNINYQYDNEFVTHAIPRSDTQYAWVKASNANTSSFSGYLDDKNNSLNLNLLNASSKFIDYEIPESPEFSYNITNSVTSSTNYSGTLYDSGGHDGNYSANELYYFTVIPTSSNGDTWETGVSIAYTLSSSVSTSLSGNTYSKMRVYFADEPALLESGSYVFPDIWYNATVVSGTTVIKESPFYVSGCLDSMKFNNPNIFPFAVEDSTTIHGMDVSGSTIFVVGNFTQITSSVSGVLPVYGAFAYNYENKTYSDLFSGSSPGPYGSPHTASWWVPYDVLYTRYNQHDYLIFSHGSRNYTYANEIFNGNNNSISIYNLTIKKWNSFANAKDGNNPYTYTDAGLKNLADVESFNRYQVGREIRFFTFDNLTESNGDIGVLNASIRDVNGDYIYPDYFIFGRNARSNITKFSIDPASSNFCSGSLYVDVAMKNEDGLTSPHPITHTFVSSSSGYDLYVAGEHLSGNINDFTGWTMIKINSDGSKSPVPLDPFYRIFRVNSDPENPIQTLRKADKIIASGSTIWMYSSLSQKAGTGFFDPSIAVSSYDTITQTFTHVTGGFDGPLDGERNFYRANESQGFFFLVGNYVYTAGEYASNVNTNNPKYLSSRLSKTTLLRYNTQYDTDNYFAPVVGNGELMGVDSSGDGSGENILFIDNINIGKHLPFSNPNHGKIFAPQPSFLYDIGKKLQFNFFNASKYNELTYPSRTFGNAITSSLENTGSNFLVTWRSNDVTASGFQLSWNKQPPTIIKRDEKSNFLGLRTNALPDQYFTDLQLTVDTDKNLLSFANTSSYTASYHLNDYLLNTNGPYQYASWQQIRNAENPLVALSRKNNFILRQDTPNRGATRSQTFSKYKEPPVDYNKPMTHQTLVANSNDIPVSTIDTYDNNKVKLSNEELVSAESVLPRSELQTHDLLINYSKDEVYRTQILPITASYTQIVFPNKNNFGISDIRKRNNYNDSNSTESVLSTNTFWRDYYKDRRRIVDSYSAYGYYTSSYQSLPNYNVKVLDSFENLTVLQGTNSNDTGSMTINFNSYDSTNQFYESIFTLDNKSDNFNATAIIERTSSTDSKNLTFSVNFGEQQVGFLTPYKQPESIYFITRPSFLDSDQSGTLIVDSNGQPLSVAKYANDRVYPRAQLMFANHQPSFTYYPTSGGVKGGIEIEGDRESLIAKSTTQFSIIGRDIFTPAVYGNEAVASKFYIINNGYTYETDTVSGKKPFYDSYEHFFEDIRGLSKNYSVVTEYKLNDFIDQMVVEGKNLSTVDTQDYNFDFSIKGHDFSISKLNSINPVEYINTSPINSNFINYENTLIPQEINIKINAILKFLPYRGFYPADRISQLSQLFIDSLFGNQLAGILDSQANTVYDTAFSAGDLYSNNGQNYGGTPVDQQMATMLQPFFAPGILLNTIKSSIATDWLTIFTDPVFEGTSYTNNAFLEEAYTGTSNSKFYIVGTSSVIPYKLPFESIIDFEKYIPKNLLTCSLHYLDPTHYSSDAIGNLKHKAVYPSVRIDDVVSNANRSGIANSYKTSWKDDRYKLAINNFLATIPDIFLQEKRLSSITSKPQFDFKEAKSGSVYYMDIELERPPNFKSYTYDRWHEYLDSEKLSKFAISSGVDLTELQENKLGSMSEDSIFGPPIKFWFANKYLMTNVLSVEPYPYQYSPYRMVSAPAYAPYVPPYYYGKSVARISFTPPVEDKKYTLEEIFSNSNVEYINIGMDNKFISRNLLLSAFNNETYNEAWKASPAYVYRSNLSSSMNLFGKKEITLADIKADGTKNSVPVFADTNYAWSIQLKYETPSINFKNTKSPETKFIGGTREKDVFFLANGYVDAIYSQEFKGLWTSYGEPVNDEDAIELKIVQSPRGLAQKQESLVDLCGFDTSERKKIGILADNTEFSEAIVVIPYTNKLNNNSAQPFYDSEYVETISSNKIGGGSINTTDLSTLSTTDDIITFGKSANNISSLANREFDLSGNKIKPDISPIVTNLQNLVQGNDDFLFKVDTNILKKLIPDVDFAYYNKNRLQQIIKILNANRDADGYNNSILKTIDLMTKYVLPPQLDWINNKVTPFAMYIFEFKKELNKIDLSDIWQNVMSDELKKAEEVSIAINHKLSELEFFHGKKLPNDIKFKIFKVKKRAKYNYFDLTDTVKDDDKFNYSNNDRYKYNSYNWPYDFYSLVELVNVEATVNSEYKQVENDNKDNSFIAPVTSPLLSKELAEAVKKIDIKKNKF